MSFLDRFQGKIATVTAQGHLKKADGSEEIRVGAPKRRPQPQQHETQSHQRPAGNNNMNHDNIPNQTMLRQPTKIQVLSDRGHITASQVASPPSFQIQRSPAKNTAHESSAVSPRGKVNPNEAKSARGPANHEYYEPPRIPGRVRDDFADAQTPQQVPAIQSPDRNARNSAIQNSPVECRSPREINESRVVTGQDQLAFSRKARPVQYEPCKLSQYKKEKPDGYYELGKLQPDLNTDELVEKRAKNERIKAFSQNLRVINKNAQVKALVESTNEQKPTTKPKSTREKGLAFARRVPKPRMQRPDSAVGELPTAVAKSTRTQTQALKARNPNTIIDDDSDDDELSAELQQLQQRHEASRAEVEALVGSI
ncbi:unnamed protein product [Phytophthora fragariaefolia]|uniref:Unnamed protein product n=1 Tax=Phytophthora fragariaefolia TaxID=1490495 RepID=A0A9W7CU82_9STRA|nr:unnamed protein product [Phytophthora fragariaefolia]